MPTSCTCHVVDPQYWTTHYGAVEPGSMYEYNPDCRVHGERLAVLPNPLRGKPGQYAIVTSRPLHPHHGLLGYKQGYGERHYGLYVYNFVHWLTAARVAHEIVTSGRTIWAESE